MIPLRLLTCNLQKGGASADSLLELIASRQVDIVCAQELDRRLGSALASLLPEGNLESAWRYRGVGIGARRSIRLTRFAMPYRDGWAAELAPAAWPGLDTTLGIVNVHIMGPHTWPYYPRPFRRRQQLDAMVRFLDGLGDQPFALAGDFNASPAWPLYRRIAAHWTDAAAQAGGPRPTWPHWPKVGIRGLIRIDHCFLSGLRACALEAIELPGTDHIGLLLDLDDDHQ